MTTQNKQTNKQFKQLLLHLYECPLFEASKYDVVLMSDAILETKFKEDLLVFLSKICLITYWMRSFTKLLSIA